MACRLLCLTPNGTGNCKATPPPAAPRCERIRSSGATESIASVRYSVGFKGRCEAGGEPGKSGCFGLMAGVGAVRR